MAISITAPVLSMALAFGVTATEGTYADSYSDVLNNGVLQVIPTRQHEVVWGNNVVKVNKVNSIDDETTEAFPEWYVAEIELLFEEEFGDKINTTITDCNDSAYECDWSDNCKTIDNDIVNMNDSFAEKGVQLKTKENKIKNNATLNANHIKSQANDSHNVNKNYTKSNQTNDLTQKRKIDENSWKSADISSLNKNATLDKSKQNKLSEIEKHKDKYHFSHDINHSLKNYNEHLVVFPVGKDKPSKIKFNNLKKYLPLNKISEVVLVGWASPDGKKPDMQEDLAYKRMLAVKKELENNNIKVSISTSRVCQANVPRFKCWKAEIFYKLKGE